MDKLLIKTTTPVVLSKIARSTNMSREPLEDRPHDEFVVATDDNLIVQSKVFGEESFNHDRRKISRHIGERF